MAERQPAAGDGAIMVYATFPDEASAERAGRALVERRLAACVNILPAIRSVYRWQGSVEEARETPMIIKSRRSLLADIVGAVESVHPYDTPAIVALDIAGGAERYLGWIAAETG